MSHKTSIIILSYNTLELLQLCIESIRTYTEAGTYEIIVVENASEDGSAAWLRAQKDLVCIYNEENQGFPKGCNQGLKIASGTELLLLNSDVIVTKDWLENMRRALYSASSVGAVSCVTNSCSNRQQIEVPYKTIEDMQAFAAGYNTSNPALWEKRATLVGFCYLFKREVFEKVGFLDERFSPGNFEDDDYSLRILQQGYDLLVCRDTFIHHFGHASFMKGYGEQDLEEKLKRSNALVERNHALLQDKWHIPEMYKRMDAEELRRLLQGQNGAREATSGRPLPKEKKIAVLLHKSRERRYEICMESLRNMNWPDGYEAELFVITQDRPYAVQVNEIMTAADAKYKIYINDDLCLVHPQMIEEMLNLFQDDSIGMIGILGSTSLPVSGSVMDSPYKSGAVYIPSEKDLSELRFNETSEAADVRFLLPSLFATQRDVPWDEAYEKQYYAVLAYCRGMEESGVRIVVPHPQEIWCTYQEKSIAFDANEADRKTYFSRHHPYLDGTEPKEKNTLYACGEESEVPSWQKFTHPESVSVGKGTQIHETALCRLAAENFAGKPRIVIGDHAAIGAGSTITAAQYIELENAVSIAENVHIKDYRLDESGVGLSPADRELVVEGSGVHIERGARLEENVLVKGGVRIGRGSIVRAGSCVQSDIPAYCIAEGSPAQVTAVFSPKAGKWLPAAGDKARKKLLAEREKTPPLLTFAFITYNRSQYLKKSLRCVLRQIGNDALAEILVSDNASTDDTRTFVEEMQKTYKNLRYHCNEKNVGAEGNIHRAIRESKGEYVLVAGDDDYFVDGSLHALITNIVRYRGVALFYLGNNFGVYEIQRGSGFAEYISYVSCFVTWLSGIVMRRALYASIKDPQKYDDTRIPQVYLQIEMLKRQPNFVVLYGTFISNESGDRETVGLNFAQVFIRNYLDLLKSEAELSPELLSVEKRRLMEKHVYLWLLKTKEKLADNFFDKFFDVVEMYYKDEPYYAEVAATLRKIVQIGASEV